MANVFDDVENNRAAAWTNGQRSVLLIIRRQPGANIIETIDRVKALLPQLASRSRPAIDVGVVDGPQRRPSAPRCTTWSSRSSSASLLVVLVVFLFLRSGWATVIPSVAVPVSLVGAFGVMYLLGYSIDNLSLMALTIATGFVVDDAIVVTENVTRFIEAGEPPFQAAIQGAKQIGFTIVSITVSLLAVFIPLLLMGGIPGRIFREFAVTLSIAIAFSALVSLTLTPMMCSRLLRTSAGSSTAAPLSLRALLRGDGGRLRSRAALGAPTTSRSSLLGHPRRPLVAHGRPLHRHSQGALPAAGHGLDDRDGSPTRRRTSPSPR